MKTLLPVATFMNMSAFTMTQHAKGRVAFQRITASALKSNRGGEGPTDGSTELCLSSVK